jgi:zinc/manganese transport system substrate-binding protein
MSTRHAIWGALLLTASTVLAAGCGASASGSSGLAGRVQAVGAESQYANVIQQIGGPYVSATGIMDNPSVDPHTYEASTRDAILIAKAGLVVQNGLGYDSFMNKLEGASQTPHQIVIAVGAALGYGKTVENPHLWYKPSTMPKVAKLIAAALSKEMPRHRRYFVRRATAFNQALAPWHQALNRVRSAYHGAPVAVTEPVADYMLQAAGLQVKTPWDFQAAIMNGTDPSPQDVQIEENLLKHHKVRLFVYNQQAVDTTTNALLAMARQHHIPVVGVYEVMPLHYSYQRWMTAEVNAVYRALKYGKSTVTL